MSLTTAELFVDDEYGLVYNENTKTYKALRIIPSSKIHGFDKVSELSKDKETSSQKENDSSKTKTTSPSIEKRLQFLSLDESNKVMSDITSKQDHKDGEFVIAFDEKNRSYRMMRTVFCNENDPGAIQGAVGAAKQLSSSNVEESDKKTTEIGIKDEVTIEIMAPFDDDLTRKIKMRKTDTFGHLVNCWQAATGSNIRLHLVINTPEGTKFIRETDTPNDLSNEEYGEMVFFDLGPPETYWDDHKWSYKTPVISLITSSN